MYFKKAALKNHDFDVIFKAVTLIFFKNLIKSIKTTPDLLHFPPQPMRFDLSQPQLLATKFTFRVKRDV
jgi:hypothetical protein